MLLRGNCLETLATLPDNSVDSIVTDPPYELGFMGKSWDNSGIAYNQDLWAQCLRVLKPGGHLLAFSGSRTYHRMTVAIEDAGFEIRDQIMWLYGSGFPKSLDVSKAIDKAAGAKRARVPTNEGIASGAGNYGGGGKQLRNGTKQVDEAITPEAQKWEGWGTALKPAHEPIVVARKPLIGTVANNVLTYGTGALNIDGSRVAHQSDADRASATPQGKVTSNLKAGSAPDVNNEGRKDVERPDTSLGRWPANVIHDGSEEVLAGFPDAKGGTWNTTQGARHFNNNGEATNYETSRSDNTVGSAARFFYCAKASKSERDAGLDDFDEQQWVQWQTGNGTSGQASSMSEGRDTKRRNIHPTVKPLALMRYLVKLVTPTGGTVLDPFLGSGTTAMAAIIEGFDWIGCEMTKEYWPIIEARTAWAQKQRDAEIEKQKPTEPTLFDV